MGEEKGNNNNNNHYVPEWEGHENVSIAELNERLVGTSAEKVDERAKIRILVGTQNNVDKAVEILERYVAFRKKHKVDEMKPFPLVIPFIGYDVEKLANESNTRPANTSLERRMDNVRRFTRSAIFKHDKEGRPVYYERTGTFNVKKLIRDCGEEDCIIAHLHVMEARRLAFEEASRKYGKLYEKWTVVLDLKGLSLSTHMNVGGINLMKHLAQVDQDYYPQTMARLLVINTPRIFTAFWKIVKPWIDPVTLEKIKIVGQDYKDTLLQSQLQFIDSENLPKEYGGTAEEELPPPPLRKGSEQYEEDGFSTVKIANGAVHEEKRETEAGMIVSWQLKPKSYDIGFEVIFEKGAEKKSIVEYAKIDNGPFTSGSYQSEEAGTVILRFDNSYASWRSKTVLYAIDVITPDETRQ